MKVSSVKMKSTVKESTYRQVETSIYVNEIDELRQQHS